MAKFKIISDIHLDQQISVVYKDIAPENAKEIILIIAGDLAEVNSKTKIINFLTQVCATYKYVLWVFGNHEYYDSSLNRAEDKVKEYLAPYNLDNLFILNRQSIILDNVKFIGATLWTDLNKGDPITKIVVSDKHTGMNDFKKIRWGNDIDHYSNKFTPDKWLDLYSGDLDFLFKEIEYSGKKVVITHHAPLLSLIEKGYHAGDRLNPAYGCNLENFVAYNDVDIWIHGHSHQTTDDYFFDTRIISNAVGGVDLGQRPRNPHFEYNKIVEL